MKPRRRTNRTQKKGKAANPSKKSNQKEISQNDELRAKRKEQFIEIYNKNACNISVACKNSKVGRSTYYEWLNDDYEFASKIKDAREAMIDFAENRLVKQINSDNLTAIIFFLKCQAKHRGYVERQELTGEDGRALFKGKLIQDMDDEEIEKELGGISKWDNKRTP